MQEHTIPESLIEQIRTGKAALVVGAGIGVSSWKQLLERMTKALETRGREGDGRHRDQRSSMKLLNKGSLVTLRSTESPRSAGNATASCRRCGGAAKELPALPALLARLPFRHVWTTFPGDILEHAFETRSPEDWPASRVVSYQELGELSKQRRTLVKLLGNFDSYIVTPRPARVVRRVRSQRLRARALRVRLARVRRLPLRRSRSLRVARPRVRHVRAAAQHALLLGRRHGPGLGRRADGRSPHRGRQPSGTRRRPSPSAA